MSAEAPATLRLTLSLSLPGGRHRQVVCTLSASRSPSRATPDVPLRGDFRRYFASFLSGAIYREFL
jgi:hypothetical protein